MGIVESETASSAQLKGVETIVAGVVDSEMEAGDSEDLEDLEMVGNNGSVCVDIDAVEVEGVKGRFD